MDNLKLACKGLGAVLNELKENGLTLPDLKILMALNIHGEQKRSNLMTLSGFSTPNQSHLTRLVKMRMIDVITLSRINGVGQKRFGYSINHLGVTALRKSLKRITG
jgi:hypothetical protein